MVCRGQGWGRRRLPGVFPLDSHRRVRGGVAVRVPCTPAPALLATYLQESLTRARGNAQGTASGGTVCEGGAVRSRTDDRGWENGDTQKVQANGVICSSEHEYFHYCIVMGIFEKAP